MLPRYVTRTGVAPPEPPRYAVEHVDSGPCTFRELKDGEPADPHESEFEYRWHHLPTGASGARRIAILGPRRIGYELLRRWNRKQTAPPAWVYT